MPGRSAQVVCAGTAKARAGLRAGLGEIPAPPFRHTRAKPAPSHPQPFSRHTRAPFPSYPRLPRVSRRAAHHAPPPPPLPRSDRSRAPADFCRGAPRGRSAQEQRRRAQDSVLDPGEIPAPPFRHTRAKPAPSHPQPFSRHTRAPFPSYPRLPRVSRCDEHQAPPPPPLPRSDRSRAPTDFCRGAPRRRSAQEQRRRAQDSVLDPGEIPAASAGMTDLMCVGVTELALRGVAERGRGGGVNGAWCWARRDTRGKRGYDGSNVRGCDGAGFARGGGERARGRRERGLVLVTARYPRQARV